MANPAGLNETINNFLQTLKLKRQLSQSSASNYRIYLNKFRQWSDQARVKLDKASDLTGQHLENYKAWLKQSTSNSGHNLSPATQNYYLIGLRAFLKYLSQTGIPVPDYTNLSLKRLRSIILPAVSAAEVNLMIKFCEQSQDSELIKKRDLAILNLLVAAGLKVSELSHLQRNALKAEENFITISRTKGRVRQIPLPPNIKNIINNYLKARHDTEPALFISHDRAQTSPVRKQRHNFALTPRSLQRIIKHYRLAAGLNKKITPSTLRHVFANQLIKQGNTIKNIQQTLGHANIITTKRYT
ncbi:MAG: tyrosine-type recombinase/integrase [Patescibacteria group bacterium]